MGAVAWGALVSGFVLAVTAVGLLRWRRAHREPIDELIDELVIDLAAAEADTRADDVAFDRIIGHLLLTDPTFADSAARLAAKDDSGPAA